MKTTPFSATQRGFTLVELAIVLVIIGLIVGGVLVGQDLIKAAQIRSVVTDLERFNAATLTFRGKYGGLPGDLLNTKATQFGFNVANNDAARNGSAGHGDGDGAIRGCFGTGLDGDLGCEASLFWIDLSRAGLIGFSGTLTSTNAVGVPTGAVTDYTNAQLGSGILPKTKLRDSLLFAVFNHFAFDGHNYFGVGEFYYVSQLYATFPNAGLTPLEAISMDQKLDDGEPTTGTVFAYGFLGVVDSPFTGTGCINADNHYNVGTDVVATVPSCALAIKPAF